jgi:hypothetical protein
LIQAKPESQNRRPPQYLSELTEMHRLSGVQTLPESQNLPF